jgi:hypothetical protein
MAATCAMTWATAANSPATIYRVSSACEPPGSKPLAADRRGRVYSLPTRGHLHEIDQKSLRIFGCMPAIPQPHLLGFSSFLLPTNHADEALNGRIDPDAIAVSSPWTAYASTFAGVDFNRLWVVVKSLRTGEAKLTHSANPRCGVEPFSSIRDIAVTQGAGVAWISFCRSPVGGSGREVGAIGPTGNFAVLDETDGIELESLDLEKGLIHWINASGRHSARFP